MGYLYKLVDEKELEYAKKNLISLSHPIFAFKGSEGKFIGFAKRIYDKYIKNGLNVEPSETDLKDIKDWCDIYKKTYGENFEDQDINSETMIVFCEIMQGFCGYFTYEDLSDEAIRNIYLSKSKLKDKIAIIKIDENVFKHLHWRAEKAEGPYGKFDGFSDDCYGFNGFLHPLKITYSEKFDDYNELLKIYNSNTSRDSRIWFDNLSKEYEWQKEVRLLFLLRSLEVNSSRIGCDAIYKPKKKCFTWEEVVYGNLIDAIDYCHKGPEYLYLQLNAEDIQIIYLKK